MSKLINTAAGEVETVTVSKTFDLDVSAGTVQVCIGTFALPSGAWQAPDVAATFSTDGKTVTIGLTFGNGHLNPVVGVYYIWFKVAVGGQTLIEPYKLQSFKVTDATGTTVGSQGPFVKTVNAIAPDASGNVTVAGGGSGSGTVTQVAGVNPDGLGHVALTQDNIGDGTTNKAYTAAEKTKLAGVATGATANSTDATLLARANHTGTESADVLTDGTTNKAYTAAERTKLAGIVPGATAVTVGAAGSGAGNALSANDATTTNSRTPTGTAGGDLTGTFPNPTLAAAGTAGTYGSASSVPVVTTDAKGRVTGVTPTSIAIPESAVTNLTTDLAAKVTSLAPTAVKTSAYTAAVNDYVPVDTTSGSVTVTLPSAPADKSVIGVKQVVRGGTNTVTIACGGTDVIDVAGGATTTTLTLVGQNKLLQYKASAGIWYVTDDSLTLSQLDARYPQLSTVTTKGDLLVATASGTLARVGVGSNTQVLTADSTQTAGVKWAAAAGGGGVTALGLYGSGYLPVGAASGNAFNGMTNGEIFFLPLVIATTTSLDRIAISVTTAGSTGSVVRLGIYGDSGRATPGSLVLDAGTVATTTTGTKEITISQSLAAGLYWVCVVAQGAPTTNPQLRGVNNSSAYPVQIPMTWGSYTSLPIDSQTPSVTYSSSAGGSPAITTTTGALPGTSPTVAVAGTAVGPNIFVRVV